MHVNFLSYFLNSERWKILVVIIQKKKAEVTRFSCMHLKLEEKFILILGVIGMSNFPLVIVLTWTLNNLIRSIIDF